jgi:hypothetical protein
MSYFNLPTSKNCDKWSNSLEKLELQYSPYHPTNDIRGKKNSPKTLMQIGIHFYNHSFTTPWLPKFFKYTKLEEEDAVTNQLLQIP